MQSLLSDIVRLGCFMKGDYVLKSGERSDYYVDFRKMFSSPRTMQNVANMMSDRIYDALRDGDADLSQYSVCGLPYAGIPVSTLVSARTGIPMLMLRKERKAHGTGKLLEGEFTSGTACILIDDVITKGTSAMESVKILRENGLRITHLVTILDRQQGGTELLREQGIEVVSLLTKERMFAFSSLNQDPALSTNLRRSVLRRSRCAHTKNLLDVMERKDTNLVASADLLTTDALLHFLTEVGPYICMAKVHCDIVMDFGERTIEGIKSIAREKDFLVMEDRKLCDIGSTARMQMRGSMKISEWADAITVHVISGSDMIKAVSSSVKGVYIVSQMSCKDNLIDSFYTRKALSIGMSHPEVVSGFICQENIMPDQPFLTLSPGVKLDAHKNSSDGMGQGYSTPRDKHDAGIDLVIVGRDLYDNLNPSERAKEYLKDYQQRKKE